MSDDIERVRFSLPNVRTVPDDELPRYRCLICEDGNWASVLSPSGIKLIRSWGDKFPGDWESQLSSHLTGIRCSCWNSPKLVAKRGYTVKVVYDPAVHCLSKPYDKDWYLNWVADHPFEYEQQEAF